VPHVSGHVGGVPGQSTRQGLLQGFFKAGRLPDCLYGSSLRRSASANMLSAEVRPDMISGFLSSELRAGQVLGLIEPEVAASVQVNRFGLVLKGHQPGKWRLIVDLSFPRGCSVNDGIEPEVCR